MKRTKFPIRGRFTFKNYERTGRFRSFDPKGCHIKLRGEIVGFIQERKSYGLQPNEVLLDRFSISFRLNKEDIMEDGNFNCVWKNATLAKKADSLKDAKEFILKFNDEIQKKFNIYLKTD